MNIAAALALNLQKKVLLVDCDPQSNTSIWLLGIKRWKDICKENSILGLFLNNSPPAADLIRRNVVHDEDEKETIPGLDLLPATYDWLELGDMPGNPAFLIFYEKLAPLFDSYDFIIFDCPPNLYSQARCGIFASTEVYIPCNPDELSRIGLDLLDRKLREFREGSQAAWSLIPEYRFPMIRGVIFNAVNHAAKNESTARINETVKEMKKTSPVFDRNSSVFTISIRQTVKAGQSVHMERPAILDKKSTRLRDDYLALAHHIASIRQ